MPDRVKVAIVGTGTVVRNNHAPQYIDLAKRGYKNFELVAVCDINEAAAQAIAQTLSQGIESCAPKVYADMAKMLKEQKPDLVDQCLPHGLHHKATIECMEAGAHVLLEKPLTITVKTGKTMIEAGKRLKKMIALAVPQRRLPGQRAVCWAIREANLIGRPTIFTITRHEGPAGRAAGVPNPNAKPDTWRSDSINSGGGPIMDSGFHFFDSVRHFFGDVESVSAFAARVDITPEKAKAMTRPMEDSVSVNFRFQSGVIGSWNWSRAVPQAKEMLFMIGGTEGAIYHQHNSFAAVFHFFNAAGKDGSIPGELRRYNGERMTLDELVARFRQSLTKEQEAALFPYGVTHGFGVEIWDAIEAVRTGRAPEVDAEDGLKTLATIMACYESIHCGLSVRVQDVLDGKVRQYQDPIDARWA
ncbi:MAG: Gfo/Idh/MocA family oxidoreductase [Candidatus Sumerlaeota bacterium]|nr:Gfo/Idh/MocA family oxidoreductase [Candidatus Sumerlaeota bacterium]